MYALSVAAINNMPSEVATNGKGQYGVNVHLDCTPCLKWQATYIHVHIRGAFGK